MGTRIQVYADEQMVENIKEYMTEKDCSQSQAGKELMELGCRVWKSSKDQEEEHLSVREMLEILMRMGVKNHIFSQFAASRIIEKNNDVDGSPYKILEVIKQVEERAKVAYEDMIDKKLEEKISA